jgi:membrane-associated phospholipid phosphatase
MSSALMTHREGIAPYWTGDVDPGTTPNNVLKNRNAGQKLKSLSDIPREVVIDDQLFARFSVDQSDLHSTLIAQATPLVTLNRPDNAYFANTQLPMVRDAADLRADRIDEILMQTEDITSFFGAVLLLDWSRSDWVFELTEAVVRLCGYIEFPFKFVFDVPRPSLLSSKVMPVIDTPTHGAWPSGHATESFALATVLAGLVDRKAGGQGRFDMNAATLDVNGSARMLMRTAMRISDNRTVAGVHYPHDSLCGLVLGVTLGEALVNWMSEAGETAVRTLDLPGPANPIHDLTEESVRVLLGEAGSNPPNVEQLNAPVDDVSAYLWRKALNQMPKL